MVALTPVSQSEVERQVQARTGRRIRDLSVEFSPDHVVLRGRTATYYLKQLAQHTVCDLIPQVTLKNDIVVDVN